MQLQRLAAARRYLSFAPPPWHWRFLRGSCPLCESTWFLSLANTPFLTRCLGCRNNLTNLAPLVVIREHVPSLASSSAFELSSYGALFQYLRTRCGDFVFSEYFPDRQPGEIVDGIRNEDVQRLSLPDGSFDLVTSNQVLEHVPDDMLAFRECVRVLRPGGLLIATVPLYDTSCTEQLACLDVSGKLTWLGEPEYHDSRFGGACSAPVFWRHSIRDIVQRLELAGFSFAKLIDVTICASQTVPQKVVLARKD